MKSRNTSMQGLIGAFGLSMLLVACGGGGGGGDSGGSSGSHSSSSSSSSSASSIAVSSYSSSANTVMLTVDGGLDSSTLMNINKLYTTVKICAPGSTTNCVTVDHVLVDTGSTGLRLMADALNSTLINALGRRTANNLDVQECMLFGSGHTWGAIKIGDFTVGAKTVSSMPLQVIYDGEYTEPTLCANQSTSYAATEDLGAKGILGIGAALYDCGTQCETQSTSIYMSCNTSSSSSCGVIALASDQQLPNPVSKFAADNNGVVISLPSISASTGANSVTGTLIFGIDTRSNNDSSAVTAYGTDSDGFLYQTTYNGSAYGTTIIDSGSNGYFFPGSSITQCSSSSSAAGWFCPSQTQSVTATIQSVTTTITSKTQALSFNIANATTQFNTGRSAFSNVGGYGSNYFLFGLPFFFGKNVFVAFDGQATSSGTGPYMAF